MNAIEAKTACELAIEAKHDARLYGMQIFNPSSEASRLSAFVLHVRQQLHRDGHWRLEQELDRA